MDELAETELHEATAGLGNWHNVDDKLQYLVNKDECMSCLQDLQIALKHDAPERGNLVHLKLGEWKVLANHLVPLFTSYREDSDISSSVLRVMVQLTTRTDLVPAAQLQHLEHLQDYKEAFAKTDVFIILMGMLVETMEEDEDGVPASKKDVFEGVLTLLRNLVSVPDPRPGDAGFTPTRRRLQLVYIRHFHDEGVLDFFLLFAEALGADQNTDQAWALGDILYHVCTHLDPEELNKNSKEKHKRMLGDLLAREQADSRLRLPQASRHARFGTALQSRTAQGGVSISTSVFQSSQVSKGGSIWRREFRDRDTEKKRSMFHDPFFVDLEEGGVRDHNQLNAHVKNVLDAAKTFSDGVLNGLRKFFEEFMQTSFSALAGLLRGTLTSARTIGGGRSSEFSRPKLLNFVSWTLEFHRHHFMASVQKAKEAKEHVPVIDIASIQGAIDLEMLQFISARLREYGKDSNIHASHLVVVLRALSQQVKTISLVMESKDADTRDCGEILTQNIVKDDVMAHLAWIMKNFKTSSHDPRVLSYAVEVFHHMLRLMSAIAERQGPKLEFRVERQHGVRMQRGSTTAAKEIASLADARVIENLFYLLEKYKRQSAALTSMLVKLIYQIIRVQPTNIVVFFELSYFVRIFRVSSDPILRDKKMGLQYQEMVSLLQYILRQFFKCAEINGCAFVELLFRKIVQENPKEALLESHTSEFQAILDNYEDEDYKARILDRIAAGETLEAMKSRQRAALDGNLPWTAEEDAVLRERYPVYSDHPLCAELLAAELPEESHRTARQVRKRLAELGLISAPRAEGRGAQGRGGTANDRQEVESNADDSQPDLPPALKAKRLQDTAADGAQVGGSQDSEVTAAKKRRVEALSQQTDDETLEMDLERLLDAAMDGGGDTFADTLEQQPAAAGSAAGSSSGSAAGDGPPGVDLEMELEALLEEQGSASQGSASAAGPAAAVAAQPAPAPALGRPPADQPATSQPAAEEAQADPLARMPVAPASPGPAELATPGTAPASHPGLLASQGGGGLASQATAAATQASQLLGSPLLRGSRGVGLLAGSQSGDLEDAAEDSGPGWLRSELDVMLGGGLQHGGSSGSLGGDSSGGPLPDTAGGPPPSSPLAAGGAAPPSGAEAPSQASQQSSQGALERDLAALMEEDTETGAHMPASQAAGAASHEDDESRSFWEDAARGPAEQARAEGGLPEGTALGHGEAGSQRHAEEGPLQEPSASQQLELDLEMIIDQEGAGETPSGQQ